MYAELHCHSNFSFHDGASSIDEMVTSARDMGYAALALTDHDNLCGAMHFARLSKSLGFKAVIGAEITMMGGKSPCPPEADATPINRGSSTSNENIDQSGITTAILSQSKDVRQRGARIPLAPFTKGGGPDASRCIGDGGFRPPASHLTILARDRKGYSNLCRLLSSAHVSGERKNPELDPALLSKHAGGLILLTGCRNGHIPSLLAEYRFEAARETARQYMAWFGPGNVYVELQQNLVYGDTRRNRQLISLAGELGIGVVATNNVHYHVRERHQLQDALVAVKHCKSLEETHRERRPNSEFYLKSLVEMAHLFRDCPEAVKNTLKIAEMCSFDLTRDLNYRFPDYPVPEGLALPALGLTESQPNGFTPQTYLEHLCYQSAVRRYGAVTDRVKARLNEEFRLIKKHNLAGFLLIYHDIIEMAREIMFELGLAIPGAPPEENMPGRGRGSSVAMLVGYLIGLSHIDPLQYNLTLERFLPEDMSSVPDIDLDFPRNIREELIKRVHEKWGWEYAVLTGMIDTYQVKGAIRDLGKALGLPPVEVGRLADSMGMMHHAPSAGLESEMASQPEFRDRVKAPVWADLLRLAKELDGFPKYLAQHPGGMVISSTPITEMVPVQRGSMDGRYICQWDKDSIDDAGFVKIDFLALGALSQLQESLQLIQKRTGKSVDLSRIDFNDSAVYDMLCNADTIGIFQVESAAQIQTIPRLRPRNLVDMAHEVGAVRPGVGVNHGVSQYLARRQGKEPIAYDHPLEKRALERTLGIILFQDQVNQVAIDVAGFSSGEADQLRRAFGRRHNKALLDTYWQKFLQGALGRGVDETTAQRIFNKFNGQYMFPESHAFAFGVTAYQASWMKYYYPLEFYVAIFNQQPMGFYNLETLKEDARRHGIAVLNPDINRSEEKCITDSSCSENTPCPDSSGPLHRPCSVGATHRGCPSLRLGFLSVNGIGEAAAKAIVEARNSKGPFHSLADVMERTGLIHARVENLISAGALDCFNSDRRAARWESGLRYRPRATIRGHDGSFENRRSVILEESRKFGTTKNLREGCDVLPGYRPALRSFATLQDDSRPGQAQGLPLQYSHGSSLDEMRAMGGEGCVSPPIAHFSPPTGYQLALSLPVEQDMAELPELTAWQRMKGEYCSMGLFPGGHIMASLRRYLKGMATSRDILNLEDGDEVKTAGIVVRRQHPLAKAYFLTLEDEFGHISLLVWPGVYEHFKHTIREPFLIVRGTVSRREGTLEVVVNHVRTKAGLSLMPKSKDWC